MSLNLRMEKGSRLQGTLAEHFFCTHVENGTQYVSRAGKSERILENPNQTDDSIHCSKYKFGR
jgi:hypothetical protein